MGVKCDQCAAWALNGDPDPDGKRRCFAHSIRPDAAEKRRAAGAAGKASGGKRPAKKSSSKKAKKTKKKKGDDGLGVFECPNFDKEAETRRGRLRMRTWLVRQVYEQTLSPERAAVIRSLLQDIDKNHPTKEVKETAAGVLFRMTTKKAPEDDSGGKVEQEEEAA